MFGADRIAGWTGEEPTARYSNAPPDPPWNWAASVKGIPGYFMIDESGRIRETAKDEALVWWAKIEPEILLEREAEKAASERWSQSCVLFRNALSADEAVAVIVTTCGRICFNRQKINPGQVFAGRTVGIKQTDGKIWLVSFMDYDLGYIDLEQKTLQTIDNPFGPRLSPMS